MVVLLESTRFIVSSGVGEIIVSADDDIAFESVIATMDTVAQAGFERVTMGDSR